MHPVFLFWAALFAFCIHFNSRSALSQTTLLLGDGLLPGLGSSISSLEAATEKFPDALSTRCNEVSSLWAPCLCTLETCIGWYPCGLKYCKGKSAADTSGGGQQQQQQQTNYRCGIKTCRKCTQFTYYVRQKQQCLWDE